MFTISCSEDKNYFFPIQQCDRLEESWSYLPDVKLLPKIQFSNYLPDIAQYPQLFAVS